MKPSSFTTTITAGADAKTIAMCIALLRLVPHWDRPAVFRAITAYFDYRVVPSCSS